MLLTSNTEHSLYPDNFLDDEADEEQLEGDALEWRGGAGPSGQEDVHVMQYLEEEEEEEEHVEEELDDLVSPLVEMKGEEGCLTVKTRKRSQVRETTAMCSYTPNDSSIPLSLLSRSPFFP